MHLGDIVLVEDIHDTFCIIAEVEEDGGELLLAMDNDGKIFLTNKERVKVILSYASNTPIGTSATLIQRIMNTLTHPQIDLLIHFCSSIVATPFT